VEMAPAAGGLTRYTAASLRYRPGEVAELARALVAPGDPPDVVAGVPGAEVAKARHLLAQAGGDVVVVLGRPSVADSGEDVAEAGAVLADGLPGVRFLPALRRGNVQGALDMGLAPGLLPGRVGLDEGRDWWSQAWGVIPEQRGLDAAGILAAAAEGRIHALVLLGADPLSDFPDAELARQGLAGAGFVVAVDAYLSESSRQADVVLAAAGYSERRGTTTNLEGRITRLGQKIVPPGVAWPDWMIASELALRLGGNLGFDRIEDIWDEVERYAPSHAGITLRLLASPLWRDGVVAPLSEETASHTVPGTGRPGGGPELLELAPDTGGATQPVPAPIDPMSDPGIDAAESQGISATEVVPEVTSGLAPEEAEPAEGAEPGAAGLPPPVRYRGPAASKRPPQLDSYSLRLVSGRTLYDRGVAVQRSPSLSDLPPAPRLRANPYDLDRLGVTTGDSVRVRGRRETFVVEAVADPGVCRGSAVLPFNLADASAAELIDAASPVTDVRLETV